MSEREEVLEVRFHGPFSWLSGGPIPSVFEHPAGQEYGVYLWSVEYEGGDLVYYVGETWRSFAARMKEHLKEYLSGMYDIFDVEKFCRGEKDTLWGGMWRKGDEVRAGQFLRRHDELWPHLEGMIRCMRFHLGSIEVEKEKRPIQRVEAAVAACLRKQSGVVGAFQDEGTIYSARWPEEEPIEVELTSDAPLLGLPRRLVA